MLLVSLEGRKLTRSPEDEGGTGVEEAAASLSGGRSRDLSSIVAAVTRFSSLFEFDHRDIQQPSFFPNRAGLEPFGESA